MKIGTHISADASDEDLRFLSQLGIEYVRVHLTADPEAHDSRLSGIRDRFAAFGLRIYSLVYLPYQAPEIAFGLDGRDLILDDIARCIEAMGKQEIPVLEYDFFLYAPLPATGTARTRGVPTREFDAANLGDFSATVNRPCNADDMRAHHEYMIRALLPVAERSGVKLALHPDDPPVPVLGGFPRIFTTVGAFERAMSLFDSPSWGILFCVGTWAEGGETMGMGICDAIRFFAEKDKLFTVHFRNVSGPLPRFHETFLDNGYIDMSEVMKTLVEVDFQGLVIPDHYPAFDTDRDGMASLAFAAGYMRGLYDQASRKS